MGVSGCTGALSSDENNEQEFYDEILEIYGDGETEFENGMEDFEQGEELFLDEQYSDSEERFRDAEKVFDSASNSFQEAFRKIGEKDESEVVLGDSEEIVGEARDIAIKFTGHTEAQKENSIQAQEDPETGKMYFQARQETIEDEGSSRSITSKTELMDEFIK